MNCALSYELPRGLVSHITKENATLRAFELPHNEDMLSLCNLYVYHNATLKKAEYMYLSQ